MAQNEAHEIMEEIDAALAKAMHLSHELGGLVESGVRLNHDIKTTEVFTKCMGAALGA